MSLLLELALQRGTLYHLLDCILLLLHLADKASRSNELLKTEMDKGLLSEEELNYPLVPFLRKVANIPSSCNYSTPIEVKKLLNNNYIINIFRHPLLIQALLSLI